MDLDPVAICLTTGSRRRWPMLIVAAMIVALTLEITAQAQAAPKIAKAWGRNTSGQLGVGTTEGPEKCGTAMETACSTAPVEVSTLSGVTAAPVSAS